ncbi:GNAT family N-acetyltransferase [Pikeienuella piscinae]|uniref:GNAT family N-acetyltransferase n=1 Tax=Pikeienuella piscinae TaxID=2748098 RepID=A0A7L5C154_9RHOB|nr:GNAT family N-acetyltransferase [Pikeienuella piscinae]QIE56206.1 GNAT family N-acetyltransferase [Pikeienuella piscinae]
MSAEAGKWLDYTVTYLEMTTRPEGPRPPAPNLPGLALIQAEDPPPRWFLHLYDSVGADYEWTDWRRRSEEELRALIAGPDALIYTAMVKGWTAGFFMLDWREKGTCDLAYFGLAPEAQGLGLGRWLLGEAIRAGWARPGVNRMVVETCTLDSPRALPLYQRMGFAPVRRVEKRRRAARG